MIIQNRDGSLIREPSDAKRFADRQPSYYAELPASVLDEQSSVIDRIISFAFDTIGARNLKLRVRDTE